MAKEISIDINPGAGQQHGQSDGIRWATIGAPSPEHTSLAAKVRFEGIFPTKGLFVRIGSSEVKDRLIVISDSSDGSPGAGPLTVVVVAEKNASCSLRFITRSVAPDYRAEKMIVACQGASLSIEELIEGGSETTLSSVTSVSLEAESRVSMVTLELSRGNCSSESKAYLRGSGAHYLHSGLFVASGERHSAFDARVEHLEADCTSDVFIKGVAAGQARGRFDGMVYVAPDAQRTMAYQQSRNLILSDTARIITSPQLEIYADDVKCSHGATVGQIDDDSIYYMRQRGLSEQEARKLQLAGFVNDIISRLSDSAFRHEVAALASERIEEL